jgi:hypothetical protein
MVSFANFRMLDPETTNVTLELIENADRQRSSFISFVSLWMGFKGWMEAVTDAPNDAAMITTMADDRISPLATPQVGGLPNNNLTRPMLR